MFDQRRDERYEGSEATLEYALDPFAPDETFDAEIVNYSRAGICIRSPRHILPGAEITIRNFMDAPSGTAVVIWSEKSDEGIFKTGLMLA